MWDLTLSLFSFMAFVISFGRIQIRYPEIRTSTQRFLQSKVEHTPELTEDIMKGKDLHQMIAHSDQGAHCLHF